MDAKALQHSSPLFTIWFNSILIWVERQPWEFLLSACKSILEHCMLPDATWEEVFEHSWHLWNLTYYLGEMEKWLNFYQQISPLFPALTEAQFSNFYNSSCSIKSSSSSWWVWHLPFSFLHFCEIFTVNASVYQMCYMPGTFENTLIIVNIYQASTICQALL